MRNLIIASAILLSSCGTPRVIERVKIVHVNVPVAAPCPLPEDVRKMPAKPAGELPADARQALAVALGWLAELIPWGEAVQDQQAVCSSVGR
jgi:hypothetical protein